MYYACFLLLMIMPLAMLVMGIRWYFKPPAYKTGRLVYRTAVTERSPEVWHFAHTHCGKLWGRFGFIMGAITVVCMLLLKDNYQKFWLWLMTAQMLILCITVFMIDILTKNLFDENGQRIQSPAGPKA